MTEGKETKTRYFAPKILLFYHIYCESVAKLIGSLVLVLHIVLSFLTEHFLHPPYCRWQQKQVRNNAYVGHSEEFCNYSTFIEGCIVLLATYLTYLKVGDLYFSIYSPFIYPEKPAKYGVLSDYHYWDLN